MGIRKTFTEMNSEEFGTIKVSILRLYSADDELVNIELCPALMTEDGNVFWDRYDSLRIYRADYEHFMIPVFDKIFPVTDPDPKGWGVQEYFDRCSLNWFGREDWLKISQMLRSKFGNSDNEDERTFCDEVAGYIESTADISTIFCIDGNL